MIRRVRLQAIRKEEAKKTQVAATGKGQRANVHGWKVTMVLSHGLRDTRPVRFLGKGGCRKGKTGSAEKTKTLKTSLHRELMPQSHGNGQSPADIWASRGLWDGPASGG